MRYSTLTAYPTQRVWLHQQQPQVEQLLLSANIHFLLIHIPHIPLVGPAPPEEMVLAVELFVDADTDVAFGEDEGAPVEAGAEVEAEAEAEVTEDTMLEATEPVEVDEATGSEAPLEAEGTETEEETVVFVPATTVASARRRIFVGTMVIND